MNWSVYLLYNPYIHRTYIGATTDVKRRLRQHNGEIKGGARSTSAARGWILCCWVSGFSRSDVFRWEKLAKLRTKGYALRQAALRGIAAGICPPGRKEYTPPEGLTFHVEAEK